MARKPVPAAERERLKERLKTLIYAGHSVREASQMCQMEETTAQKWATRYGWRREIKQVKQLVAQSSESVPSAKSIVFDRALTGRETRNAYARAALKTAQHVEAMTGEEIYASASNFKQSVEAAAKLDGTWESTEGNKFAVSLQLNTLIQNGGVTEIPEGSVVEIEE